MGIISSFGPNIHRVKLFLSILFLVLIIDGFTQSSQSEYLEAKRQLSLGNYNAAKLGFQELFDDKDFGPYGSFYFALASYKNSELQKAYDMWRQVSLKFPNWDQQLEVNYWLARSAFELNRYSAGFNHLKKLPSAIGKSLLMSTVEVLSYDELVSAYQLNPDEVDLATVLVNKILSLPYSQRDRQLLAELAERFDEISIEEVSLPEIKKEKYAISVVLPFMFESFSNPQTVIRNSIIWDLYNGMKQAQMDLEKEGIKLELFPFDTKKRADITEELVASGKLENSDLIIGPLYNQPHEIISSYAIDQKINMINPLSSNGTLIGDNPYSYLFKPSYETQGRKAAKYMASKVVDNKLAFVFYETDRDSLLAKAYLDEIQKDDFFIVRFERLTNESAQQVQRDFTEKYEIRLDIDYSKREMDSIGLLPGRFVKSRPLRNKTTGDIIKDTEGKDVLEYYEERLRVKEDSIGHILVASSSNLLANNFISLSEVRNDTIEIIGYTDWLDFSTVSYNQLERLGISFISPTLFKKDTVFYDELKDSFIDSIGREPGEYHLIGYELIYQIGQLMDENGRYFQRGLLGNDISPGRIMYGLNYSTYHDNQVVPITKLEDLRLVIQEEKEGK